MAATRLPDAQHAWIGFGRVRHMRLRPAAHGFSYRNWFILLPMRSLAACANQGIGINRRAAVSFFDQDHGDGRSPAAGGATAWLDEMLAAQGIHDARGALWLHTYPRVLGYTFKPVSFWYCHRVDGSLRAIVAEVNNTFGQRHCYLLDRPVLGVESVASKVFHVSPFCSLAGQYRFRFMHTQRHDPPRTVARIDYDDDRGPLLQTSVSGQLELITPAALRKALWRYPAMTWMVMARIHWQALKLWCKRVGLHRPPPLPPSFVSRCNTDPTEEFR
jgi:DUF1365 family protein